MKTVEEEDGRKENTEESNTLKELLKFLVNDIKTFKIISFSSLTLVDSEVPTREYRIKFSIQR